MSEPFPLLNTSADALHNGDASLSAHKRRHRKSSALGASDIRAGDTGAPAMASSRASLAAKDEKVRMTRGTLLLTTFLSMRASIVSNASLAFSPRA